MAMALEARGFQSSRRRTTLDRHPLRSSDVAAGLTLLAITGLYLWLWYRGVLALR
jgi:energy-coupling factor transporter transmembrane protein EcfT